MHMYANMLRIPMNVLERGDFDGVCVCLVIVVMDRATSTVAEPN